MEASLSLPSLFPFVIFVVLLLASNTNGEKDELVLVQILYRHGDRSPVGNYPTDKIPESAWPQGFGQLSTVGMEQHYELGKFLRQRYMEDTPFLSSSYSRYEVQINSTDYDRTLMSAYSNLAGLYTPDAHQIWNQNFTWQPIPVHTRPVTDDHVLHISESGVCAKFDEYYQKSLKSDAIVKEETENAEFYQFLSNKSGIMDEGLEKVWQIYDTMFCERRHNHTLPPWATQTWSNSTDTVFSKMAKLESLQFDVMFDHPIQNRLSGGPLLKEVVARMNEKMSGQMIPEQRKAFIYSAHDTTVAAFLSAAEVFNRVMPPYASCVMVELRNTSHGDYKVSLYFRNGTTEADMHPLTLPNCTHSCLFSDFLRIVENNIPGDWEAECRDDMGPSYLMIIVASACSAGLLVFAVIVGVCICRWRKRRQPIYFSLQAD